MKRDDIKLNHSKRVEILKLFYRTEFYDNEDVIENSDEFIANKLNIPKSKVSNYLTRHLTQKFKHLNKKINLTKF